MRNTKIINKNKRKILLLIVCLIFIFFTIKIGEALAAGNILQLTSVEIKEKSDTTEINDISFNNNNIISNVAFCKVGDYITYKIKIKNANDVNYTIKTISDDNKNEYISYIYDKCEGKKINKDEEIEFYITEKYIKEVSNIDDRNQMSNVSLNFKLEDENGNMNNEPINLNPKTGDDIGIYIAISLTSIILFVLSLVLVKNKQANKPYFNKSAKVLIFLLVVIWVATTIVKAMNNETYSIKFKSTIKLKDKLVVSYKINEDTDKLIVNYNKKISTDKLPNPIKEGYEFIGWKLENGTYLDMDTEITDDINITAVFSPNEYIITYNLNGGIVSNANPTKYTIESDDITLNNPSKENYIFMGWTGTGLTDKTENVTIQKGSTGAKEYIANWKPKEFVITYNLDGGTVSNANPTKYTIESDNITLNNPTKDNFTFLGWTGTGLTDKTENVTIQKGSTGDREYIANWKPKEFIITYNLDEGTVSNANPTKYTIESDNITLNNPTKDNFTFLGWTGTGLTDKTENVTIQKGSTGDREYTANWKSNLNLKLSDTIYYAPSGSYTIGKNVVCASGTTYSSAENTDYRITEWKVFNIDNNTGKVQLVPSNPTKGKFQIEGFSGYNNGVKALNDTCSALYSTPSKGIVARSIKIEDIESMISPEKIQERKTASGYGSQIEDADGAFCPILFMYEKNAMYNNVLNETGLGQSESLDEYINPEDYRDLRQAYNGAIPSKNNYDKPLKTYYSISNAKLKEYLTEEQLKLILPTDNASYHIATRSFYKSGGYMYYAMYKVYNKQVTCGYLQSGTGYSSYNPTYSLFPVVTLDSNLITGNEVDGYRVDI